MTLKSDATILDTEIFGEDFNDLTDPNVPEAELVNASIEEAYEILNENLETLLHNGSVDNGEQALMEVIGGAISNLDGIEIEQAYTHRPAAKNPFKINGYGSLYDGHTLVLFVAHRFNDGAPVRATQEECTELARLGFSYVGFLLKDGHLQLPEGSEDREIADHLKGLLDKAQTIRFLILTDRDVPLDMHFPRKRLSGRQLSFDWWGISQYAAATDSPGKAREIVLDVEEILGEEGRLFCLEGNHSPDGMHVFITLFPGKLLKEIYNRWGQASIEANIRSYLSAGRGRTKANRGIAQTIKEAPQMFLPYNNGITLTATEVVTQNFNGRPVIKTIKGLQIVNGGQTTASLFYSGSDKLEEVEVATKIVSISGEHHAHVKNISTYSNRQNQVKESDLSSNELFNVNRQKLSRDTALNGQKWYYERNSSQYANEALLRKRKGELHKFELEYPKDRKFDKTEAASVLSLWDGFPHDTSAGGQTNFTRWYNRNRAVLNDPQQTEYTSADFKELVAKVIIWRTACATHKPRYKDYRRQVSNYTVALIAMHFGDKIDYKTIWNAQGLSEEFTDAIAKLGDFVIEMFKEIADDRDVTYCCKTVGMWDEMKKLRIDFNPNIIPEFNNRDI